MRVTIFGILWTAALLIAITRKKYNMSIFMLLLAGILQCDAIIFFGEANSIGVLLFTCILVDTGIIINMIGNRKKIRFDRNVWFIIILLLSILASNLFNGVALSFSVLLSIAPLAIYFVTYICLKQILGTISVASLDKMIEKVIIVVLVVGILQYLIALEIIPNLGLLRTFVYNEVGIKSSMYFAAPTTAYSRRVYSTFMEPSYCAVFLAAALFFLFDRRKKIKNVYLWIVICVIELLLTRSSTGYGCAFLCAVIYIIINRRRIPVFFVAGCIAMVLLVGVLSLSGTIDMNAIIFDKASTGSGSYRAMLNEKAMTAFRASKIFGQGFKAIRASSIIHTLLGELGLVGIFSYSVLCLHNLLPYFKKAKHSAYGYMIWLFAVVAAQVLACPDLDFCLFWFALYVLLGYNLCEWDVERPAQ